MTAKAPVRNGKDRLRYTLSFELTLMAILIPAGAAFFDKPLTTIGMLGAMLALKAVVINFAYNWVFDHFDAKSGRVSSDRSVPGRILHAVGFEVSLMITSLPIYAWWLGIGLVEALATDLVVTSFVVAYTYVFTLIYDRAYPVRAVPPLSQA